MQRQLLHCSPFLSIPNNGKLCLAAASVLSCTKCQSIWILRNPDDGCLNILLTASDLLGLLCAVGYGSYFGKKLDPEPGRCRRTDGKKWRCSKEAAPDSKYCERHMHRGRNRSRKPVETQLVPPSQPPATAAASPAAPLAAAANGSSFQNHSLYPAIAGSTGGGGGASNMSSPFSSPLGSSPLHMDNAASYAALCGGTAKDLR